MKARRSEEVDGPGAEEVPGTDEDLGHEQEEQEAAQERDDTP